MTLDRRYVVASVIAAFISWALLTDWIPSLRWIPHAFVAGALSTLVGFLYIIATTSRRLPHGSWDGYLADAKGRKMLLGDSAEEWEEEKAILKAQEIYHPHIVLSDNPQLSRAVDRLLHLVLRDYVTSWYTAISPRRLFQNQIDRCIRQVLEALADRLTAFDLVEVGFAKVLPIVTAHLHEFYDAERLVRGKDLSHNVTESEELNVAIAGKYQNGRLHTVASLSIADTTAARQAHLRALVERLLPGLMPKNMRSSSAVLVLVREIVSCAVLSPVVQLLLEPDTWNQLIVNLGGPMLQDRKAVRKMRAALDQNSPASSKTVRGQFPRLQPYDGERQFERFIRAIRQTSTISDARRFRSEVVSQFRRESNVDGQDAAYLRRLETGKKLLDQKIATLQADMRQPSQPSKANGEGAARKRQASLQDLLRDASGLSYFMEYMDRLKLTRMVQFYIVVDGFRGPLEGDADDLDPSVGDDPDKMDVALMYEGYLSKPEIRVTDDVLIAVRDYLKAGRAATGQKYIEARQAVLRTQTHVYATMRDTHFESFKKTDLYYKWLALDDGASFSTNYNPSDASPSPSGHSISRSRDSSPAKRRPQLGSNRESELRRAVLSSSNLKDVGVSVNALAESRRSLDDSRGRAALFDDDVDDERMTGSVASVRSFDSDADAAERAREETKAVNAIQRALDDIMGDEDKDSIFSAQPSTDLGEGRPSIDMDRGIVANQRPSLNKTGSEAGQPQRPSIASLGLVGAPSNRGVFFDDLFGHEAENFAEDEREDSEGADDDDQSRVQEAAPGDLGLTEAIDALNVEIERLSAQNQIVESLTAKAELTNNAAELRVLRKSEQSLQREIRRKELQKQQYIVQEGDNSLFGRAAVTIKSVMIGREQDGREFALYMIEVRRQAGEQMSAAIWTVTRRYSQFHELHKRLRARFPSVRDLDFPRRQALFTLQKDFVEKRRITLDRYLRSLLLSPAICRSRELRAFLSQSTIPSGQRDGNQIDAKDFVTRIYSSVSDGMEDLIGNIAVLDQLSVAGQSLITAATSQISSNGATNHGSAPAPGINGFDPITHADAASALEAEAELNVYDSTKPSGAAAEPFVKPICDLFLEAFELSKGKSWLRGRTVVLVLHQLLGGTVERKVRDSVRSATCDASLARYVDMVIGTMWPDGVLRRGGVERTDAEKARTRKEAAALLDALVPDLAGSVVGRANAKACARKVCAVVNNRRLNTHFIFTLVDELVKVVFPEA